MCLVECAVWILSFKYCRYVNPSVVILCASVLCDVKCGRQLVHGPPNAFYVRSVALALNSALSKWLVLLISSMLTHDHLHWERNGGGLSALLRVFGTCSPSVVSYETSRGHAKV
jgi:hypothetical protein